MKFKSLNPNISNKEIELFEQNIGGVLSLTFKKHYLEYNGGKSLKSYFKGDEGAIYVIQNFLSITKGNDTIEETYKDLKDYLPSGLVPFARDPGGNYFCIDFLMKKMMQYIFGPMILK